MTEDMIDEEICLPDFMKKCHEELMAKKKPNEDLKKRQYVIEWIQWFDARSFPDNDVNLEYAVSEFTKFTKAIIKDGFTWTVENFATLDLGGNMGWYGAARQAMRIMRNGKWDSTAGSKLKFKIRREDTCRRW